MNHASGRSERGDMDDRLERLLQKLSVAINESVSTSEQIRGVIAQIGDGSYDVLLFLNATIAVMKRDEEAVSLRTRTNGKVESGFNPEDVQFLKSMHISVK